MTNPTSKLTNPACNLTDLNKTMPLRTLCAEREREERELLKGRKEGIAGGE